MQKFEDVFAKYIEKGCNSPLLRQSEVTGLQIATEDNAVRITLSSQELIPYSAIAEAQRALAMGLSAYKVSILAHYPQELLGENAFTLKNLTALFLVCGGIFVVNLKRKVEK